MQPLISVEHESRHNSQRIEDVHEQVLTEETPLLHRFPENNEPVRNPVTTAIVSALLVILVSGVIIGVYLLILQSDAENVLPPVEMPLQFVNRMQWDRDKTSRPLLSSPIRANKVIVVQTDTKSCTTSESCINLLRNIQMNSTTEENFLPYNFLISSNGQTYEGLGWHKSSPLFPGLTGSALVLGFIGNYTDNRPTRVQIEETKNFFSAAVSQQYLQPSFIIIGKNINNKPIQLFLSMSKFPQWSSELSDN